jgi:hypothetical protein
MKDLAARIAALPPEKRAQLEAHLRKSGMSLPRQIAFLVGQ